MNIFKELKKINLKLILTSTFIVIVFIILQFFLYLHVINVIHEKTEHDLNFHVDQYNEFLINEEEQHQDIEMLMDKINDLQHKMLSPQPQMQNTFQSTAPLIKANKKALSEYYGNWKLDCTKSKLFERDYFRKLIKLENANIHFSVNLIFDDESPKIRVYYSLFNDAQCKKEIMTFNIEHTIKYEPLHIGITPRFNEYADKPYRNNLYYRYVTGGLTMNVIDYNANLIDYSNVEKLYDSIYNVLLSHKKFILKSMTMSEDDRFVVETVDEKVYIFYRNKQSEKILIEVKK